MLELKVPPPLIALVCALLMYALDRLTVSWSVTYPVLPIVAVLLALIGIAVALVGVIQFHRAGTTIHPLHPQKSRVLVRSGIYRYTRNPMYLGMAMVVLAWAIALGSGLALSGFLLFVLWITRFQIVPEERALQSLFGEQFSAYQQATRRWI